MSLHAAFTANGRSLPTCQTKRRVVIKFNKTSELQIEPTAVSEQERKIFLASSPVLHYRAMRHIRTADLRLDVHRCAGFRLTLRMTCCALRGCSLLNAACFFLVARVASAAVLPQYNPNSPSTATSGNAIAVGRLMDTVVSAYIWKL